ncbi:MAG: hypothetical protein NC341_04080 [Blautia sp.]|nr:hypothetical protein [Blautia sp.]MCM1200776.1 hypothetical protein [Bacteroides fragilis]
MSIEVDWIQDIVETTIQNFNNRKIILWGKYSVSDVIREELEEHNITNVIYVDRDEKKWDEREVFPTEIIDGRSDSYYIVIPVGVYDSIRKKLIEAGYKQIVDYYYFSDCIVKESEKYYEDAHGNRIIGNRSGLKFVFSGWNSEITIGNDVEMSQMQLYMHNDMHILIGNGVRGQFKQIHMEDHSVMEIGDGGIIDGTRVEIGEYSKLKIGKRALIGGAGAVQRIVIRNNANVIIGDDFSVTGDFFFLISSNTTLEIGKDNMFSWGVRILTADGHSIFDVKSGEVINSTQDSMQRRKVVTGNHVWVGLRATLFYGTNIGNGSMVGACSLVKETFPNNCMIAGIPAKMIKKDISWSRKSVSMDIKDCGEDYINYTIIP